MRSIFRKLKGTPETNGYEGDVRELVPEKFKVARITIVSNIYHQLPGDNPYHLPDNCELEVASEEEPYQRKYKLGDSPVPIDTGWIEEIGLVHIANLGDVSATLKLGDLEIPPYAPTIIFPRNRDGLEFLPCQPTRVQVTIFPK